MHTGPLRDSLPRRCHLQQQWGFERDQHDKISASTHAESSDFIKSRGYFLATEMCYDAMPHSVSRLTPAVVSLLKAPQSVDTYCRVWKTHFQTVERRIKKDRSGRNRGRQVVQVGQRIELSPQVSHSCTGSCLKSLPPQLHPYATHTLLPRILCAYQTSLA
jgi:hypothetical protein